MTLTKPFQTVAKPLKNGAYGFPQGSRTRRIDPFVLICIHISGNKRTASMPVSAGTAAEVAYVARPRHFGTDQADYGNSCHDYIARDGTQFSLYPTSVAGWNNGRLLEPDTRLASVRRILKRVAQGYNANECYVREVECTGFPGSYPLTKEQRETVAWLIARDSIKYKIGINRETVHGHFDVDSVNRATCPVGGGDDGHERFINDMIAKARKFKAQMLDQDPGPDPDPEPGPDPDPEPDYKALYETAQGLLEATMTDLDAIGKRVANARKELRAADAIIDGRLGS